MTAVSNDNLLFDWVPHVDRLKREAEEASLAGREAPWALAEAECWLDLVEAELEAHRAMRQDRPEVAAGLHRLQLWRTELQFIIRRLHALGTRVAA